ncbi:MAG: leucine-rich repeat domain-containing protein [Muribaculaceae bacterium]|nr:leucine-rich repeat domain-containing protein [Muribaculaceae bacterium]
MPFVEAKCTNCGAVLSVDNTKNLWICNYCQTPFIFEKSINNYNVTDYNNITANTVNVFDEKEPDFVIRNGKLKVYRGISRDVVIPNSVEEICASAFWCSTYLKSIIIPNSVKKMEGAFFLCTSLQSVDIQYGVTNISNAFEDCTSLKSVTIPNSVKKMEYAFKGCTSLKSVDIQYGVTNISNAFEDCTSLKSVTIPNSVKKMEYAFKGCTSLKSVDIQYGVKNISNTFEDCTSLTSVIIPNSVTYIESAFSGCTSLKSIKIPKNVNCIDENDFKGCCNLTDIDYPYLKEFADCFPAIKERKRKRLCIYCGSKLSLLKECKSCGMKN